MILISYDIADDKLRTKFSKYIRKFGHRIQYSLYEIDNDPRTLKVIIADIEAQWVRHFSDSDSVLILNLSKTCEIKRYGYARHDENDLIII